MHLPADYVIRIRLEEVSIPLDVLTFQYMYCLYFDDESMEDLIQLAIDNCQTIVDKIQATEWAQNKIIVTANDVISVTPVYPDDWNEYCFEEVIQ